MNFTRPQRRLIPPVFVTGLVILFLSQYLGSCGGSAGAIEAESAVEAANDAVSQANSTISSAQNSILSSDHTLVEVPIIMRDETEGSNEDSGLNLANGDAIPASIVITLANCTSGLTGSNSSQSSLTVYLNDTNCLAKLTSFSLYSQTFQPSGAGSSPFTTWLAGDTATFIGSSGDSVKLKVVSQLNSPTTTTELVSYSFTAIKVATNSVTSILPSGQSLTLTVAGRDAPNFKINSGHAVFENLVSSGGSAGAGIFNFKLTCVVSAMTVGANASYNSFCPATVASGTLAGGDSGVDIGNVNNFSYKLIADPNGNGTLTLAQAQTAMSTGSTTITLATDLLAANAGFQTISLTGPVTITSQPKIILILQAKDTAHPSDTSYSSFQYFPITVQAITP